MTVLVVAGEGDRTANGVVRGLCAQGVDVVRIDTGWFPQRLTLDAEFANGQWVGELRTCSRTVALDELRAIWYRSPTMFQLPEGMSSAERQYTRREGKLGLGGVLTALPVLAVNDPHNAARAVYKPLQLGIAAACGLAVPDTQITNRADAVRRFAATAGDGGIVTKALGTTLVHEEDRYKLGYTRRLTASDLIDLRGVEVTAHQQQVWVKKREECRVVVIGDRVFAVAIHAGSEASRIDWRSDYSALSYQVVEPPESVIKGVRGVMAQLGLQPMGHSISPSTRATSGGSSRSTLVVFMAAWSTTPACLSRPRWSISWRVEPDDYDHRRGLADSRTTAGRKTGRGW